MKQNIMDINQLAQRWTDMIAASVEYGYIQDEIYKFRVHLDEKSWENIGDVLSVNLLEKNLDIFEALNAHDFSMQIYSMAGSDAIVKKLAHQFELAKNYSDQGGLERKFSLYEGIVEETFPLIQIKTVEDKMHYFFTRALNRLAQLTQYWKGEEDAYPLWDRLANYAKTANQDEKISTLQIISSYAPWFVEQNQELFISITN